MHIENKKIPEKLKLYIRRLETRSVIIFVDRIGKCNPEPDCSFRSFKSIGIVK